MDASSIVLVSSGAVVALVALSAFFSSSETAIFTLSEAWLDAEARTGDDRATLLVELREDPHRLLVTILVGNNIVNVAISSIMTAVLIIHLPTGWAVTAATLLASSIVLVFGEIVPKSYGLGNAPRWAMTVARPIAIVERGLYPLVVVFDAITRRMTVALGGDQEIEQPYIDT